MNLENNLNNIELIRVPSGVKYQLTNHNISYFIQKAKEIISKFIKKNDIVAFFLSIGDMNFSQFIIYNACIECGASVIRCTISDIERQIPVVNEMEVDVIIIGSKSLRHIESRINYNSCILYESIDTIKNNSYFEGNRIIYEFPDIPGFMLYADNSIYCPGYSIRYHRNQIFLSGNHNIHGFQVENYCLDLSKNFIIQQENEIFNVALKSYIKYQIKFLLNNILCINSENNEIILDSLGLIEFLVNIEELFNVTISMDNVNSTDFLKLDNINDLIYKLLVGGE
ncbi:MAG: hypothetical protein K0R00_280 [Herbinix sp.]|jgi:acyl carrier protein|nr:hypothetical protein [Herbinix sp.]